jgi:hypothetical protein
MSAALWASLPPAVAAFLLALAGYLRSRTTQSQLQSHVDTHAPSNTAPSSVPPPAA